MSEQPREFCPNLTSPDDLVNKIGLLSVDILNKEKVIAKMWENIDSLTEELKSLVIVKDSKIYELKKTLKGVEIEALNTEEEIRKELMETRSKLFSLTKNTKKKKMNSKSGSA